MNSCTVLFAAHRFERQLNLQFSANCVVTQPMLKPCVHRPGGVKDWGQGFQPAPSA